MTQGSDSSVSPFAAQAGLAMQQSKGSGKTSPLSNPNASPDAVRKAATDFESVFATQMLTQMFSGVKTDAMFGGGHGEEMYRSMMLDEYGKAITKHGGLGIADAIMKTLISEQEKSK